MYVSIRTLNVQPARFEDALGVVGYVVAQINENHGGALGYSVMVGGDPSAIAVSGNWETLGQFEQARASWMGDQELGSAMRMGSELLTGSSDMILQVLKPLGDPGAYALVNTASMHMPAVTDAIGFAVEVAEFAEGKTGVSTGVVSAYTGNRSMLSWVGYASDLDEISKNSQALETDADYLEFFKRSEGLFQPGTLEQNIWQMLG